MLKKIFPFIVIFSIDLGLLYVIATTWNTPWALIWGFVTAGCIFATIQIVYLSIKTKEWPTIVGGPSVTYLNQPRKK